MEDMNFGDIQGSSRYRSPSFSREEVDILLTLIQKYKVYILNKSVSSVANQAKEAAWGRIEREFDSQAMEKSRSAATLKVKWENLKREARKLSKNIIDIELDAVISKTLALMAEADTVGAIDFPQVLGDEDIENGFHDQKDSSNSFTKPWEEDSDDNYHPKTKRVSRALNFSPRECSLLLQCVKKEKKQVFSKDITKKAIELKNSAWIKIADSYNKISPEKRTAQTLKTKFTNIKRLANKTGFREYFRDVNKKHGKNERLVNANLQGIKTEPLCEDKMTPDSDACEENDDICCKEHEAFNGVHMEVPVDPLSSVLNRDLGIGSSTWNWNPSQSKEIDRLKLELLNYQMETAKLERKRIEDAMQEEAAGREARATETALRLRGARLQAEAAAARLPPAHPALAFPPEEARAHHYLTQYHQA